jgi:S-adenosylmethionine synthetase
MFEKVSPNHPDKIADRIAGAIVDLCYTKSHDPKVACEVLIGHGEAGIQVETSEQISAEDCEAIVRRIAGEDIVTRALIVPQDANLAANQRQGVRAGDNGLFKGVPPTHEQKLLTSLAATIYENFPYDGKYLAGGLMLNPGSEYQAEVYGVTICQSHATEEEIDECMRQWEETNFGEMKDYPFEASCINPLGPWTGGPNTDSGATNRKLGSDMGDGVTGGGLNGKDLSKCDVSVNIACFILAQRYGTQIEACCSIGDEHVTFNGYYCAEAFSKGLERLPITMSFRDVVEMARLYILTVGGFEKFSMWGLLRP